MHVVCKCLNVSIRSKGTELQPCDIDNIELTDLERSDDFFRESLASVPELETITKEQPGLVEIRNIGSWIIHRCYNCSMYTHAVHREYGAALVLINSNIIISPEEISKLNSNPDYSPIFRIVIDHSLEDLDEYLQPNKFSVSQLPNNIQVALGGLQRQLEEGVQHQTAMIEDKIRTFSMEQYQLLEQFRERAHNEHRLLSKLVCRGEERTNRVTNNIETPPTTPDNFKNTLTISAANMVNGPKPSVALDDAKSFTGSNVKYETAIRHSSNSANTEVLKKKKSLYICTKRSASFDTETLFTLDGVEDADATDNTQSPEEESDTDDSGQDEGIHMPKSQRDGHSTLAKSLPVTVPTFPSIVRRSVQDQDDDQLPDDPLDPHNIRASIKALAKSVHGDTIFGDLPRPRFSSQI